MYFIKFCSKNYYAKMKRGKHQTWCCRGILVWKQMKGNNERKIMKVFVSNYFFLKINKPLIGHLPPAHTIFLAYAGHQF